MKQCLKDVFLYPKKINIDRP